MSGPADLQRRFYDMLMESQYWPADRLRDYQRSQLAQLLKHAKAHVPFYEYRLDSVLKPNGDIDWDRWNEIPILTRADLQDHHESMQAKMVPAGHGQTRVDKSSGSTGRPIETTHNLLENWAGNAALLRAFDWHNISFDRAQLNITGDNPAVAAWPDGRRRGAWGPEWAPGKGERYELNITTEPEQIAQFLAAGDFAYVSVVPSRFESVAYAAQDLGLDIQLDAILPRGQDATAAQRELFRDVFGARCMQFYSASETFKMAHGCPDHDHYHVHAELGLVEILGDDGRSASPGTPGRVVVTPFYNTAQPLIRYDLGDLATAGAACSCGRTLPVIERIIGRTYHLFTRRDGRKFVPSVPQARPFELGLGMWQLAQVAAGRAEFRYVSRSEQAIDRDAIGTMLQSALPAEFQIDLVEVDGFNLAPRAKHILYVNEMRGGER
jgi:phenylacetate-CoA ligase